MQNFYKIYRKVSMILPKIVCDFCCRKNFCWYNPGGFVGRSVIILCCIDCIDYNCIPIFCGIKFNL